MRSHYGHNFSRAHYDITDRFLLDIWCDTCQCDATPYVLYRILSDLDKFDYYETKYNVRQGYG